jgi:uncharacterized protein YjiS (DUF1127 family)
MQTSTLPNPRGLDAALNHAPGGASGRTTPGQSWLDSIFDTLHMWQLRSRSRRDLRTIVSFYHSLGGPVPWGDLGGTRGELLQEARKPFWRA